ncbi:alpha/beta hydrolase [Nocardioides sp. NBC_00163]|uniref:alpha/beta hydrolase n=1 Tax=Nocardioides sp. NBC_00163 TaxID=2975999 RepID=UPI00324DBC4C
MGSTLETTTRGIGFALLVLGTLLGTASLPASAGPASDPAVVAASVAPDNQRVCRTSTVPVDLQPGIVIAPGSELGPALDAERSGQYIFVKLCLPKGQTPRGVQVLVHGITYDHRYWNIADPADPEANTYSWEYHATRAGYATVAIDRLGNGASSHPPSNFVDITSNATALHNLVQALRAGEVAAPGGERIAFSNVALVGHSYGSFTSMIEASRFRDVDAVILTGFSHKLNASTALNVTAKSYPAALDPQFAGTLLDAGYLTPEPGNHQSLFYAPATDVDGRIIERDEATKGTFTAEELDNYPLILATPLRIDVPTLIVNGTLDGIFCGQSQLDLGTDCSTEARLVEQESPYFPDAPSLSSILVPGAGHDLNAFRPAPSAFQEANGWLARTMPPA